MTFFRSTGRLFHTSAALYLKELLSMFDLGRGNRNWIQSLISRVVSCIVFLFEQALDLFDYFIIINLV